MVVLFQVAQLMGHHVIDALFWDVNKLGVQRNPAGSGTAAPAGFHTPVRYDRSADLILVKALQAGVHLFGKYFLRPIPKPALKQLFNSIVTSITIS